MHARKGVAVRFFHEIRRDVNTQEHYELNAEQVILIEDEAVNRSWLIWLAENQGLF
jgi:hypothetical protein